MLFKRGRQQQSWQQSSLQQEKLCRGKHCLLSRSRASSLCALLLLQGMAAVRRRALP